MTVTVCPYCAGPWQPHGERGVLHYQHAPTPRCPADDAEVQTQLNDWTTADGEGTRRGPSVFDRPATPTEVELLTHAGYAPAPGLTTRVDWTPGVRRRTFPNLSPVAGLPSPR